MPILEDARPIGPQGRNESYRVALLKELLLLEWAYRQEVCEELRLQEYQARFPVHTEAVARCWQC